MLAEGLAFQEEQGKTVFFHLDKYNYKFMHTLVLNHKTKLSALD